MSFLIAPDSKPSAGPSPSGPEPKPPRRGIVWRFVLGCLIVLLASAGATAVLILEQVHTVVQDLHVNKPLVVDRKALAPDYYGGPETLLMVGDDWRPATRYYPHAVPHLANEMLLVRIDPSKPYISLLSIPRELWVTITPPNGATYTNRLNSAYTWGLTTLLNTIKHITGLSVNHVIATTFGKFENAIDKLGCVYSTIDERYYHNNADGGDQYQDVNLQPGYQCLSGSEAEQFVSYRHTDSSQIRDSRDQAFLLDVKKQYGPALSGNIGKFEKIFGQTVRTDPGLDTSTEILNLAYLLVKASGLRVRQVPFLASPLPNGDLTATPEQIQQSVHNFLHGGQAPPTRQTAAIARKVRHRGALAQLTLTATLASNVAAEKAAVRGIPFTAEFPTVQDLSGSAVPVSAQCTTQVEACVRDYLIHAPGGKAYPIYDEVFSNGQLGQFYEVQGTTWTDAPLFADPNQTLPLGARTYELYYDGSQLQTVAWHEYGAWYWVHNTLSNAVDNGELLAVAEQTKPLTRVTSAGPGPPAGAGNEPTPNLRPVFVPTRIATTPSLTAVQTVGSIGGMVAMLALPLLLAGLVHRRRRLRRLRADLIELEDRRARLLIAVQATRRPRPAVTSPPVPAESPAPPVHVG